MIKHLWILFLFTSCFKTAEEIKREKMVDQMNVQLEQSSQLVASLTQQVNDLQSRLANTTGQIEEIDHFQKKSNEEQSQTMRESLSQLEEQVKALAAESAENKKLIASLSKQLAAQKKYVNKVNRTLGKMASSGNAPTLAQAHKLFEKSKMTEAKEAYLEVLERGKINAAQRNAVWYNLGLISYRNKNFEDAMTYFSKIYTKWPKSSYAPRALLYIGRSFAGSGKQAEANAAFDELIKSYPKSAQAREAAKEKK